MQTSWLSKQEEVGTMENNPFQSGELVQNLEASKEILAASRHELMDNRFVI